MSVYQWLDYGKKLQNRIRAKNSDTVTLSLFAASLIFSANSCILSLAACATGLILALNHFHPFLNQSCAAFHAQPMAPAINASFFASSLKVLFVCASEKTFSPLDSKSELNSPENDPIISYPFLLVQRTCFFLFVSETLSHLMFQRRSLPVFLSEITIYLVMARFTLIGLI